MEIIEIPFKENQIFKFKNNYYKYLNVNFDVKCKKCQLDDCTDFQVNCNEYKKFKKIPKSNDNNCIDIPFKKDQVFKYLNCYYKTIKSNTNNCCGCDLEYTDKCIGNYINCDYKHFKKIDYYKFLFMEEK